MKPKKAIATLIHFQSADEKKRAFARAQILHGNHGFSRYVRTLITSDLMNQLPSFKK